MTAPARVGDPSTPSPGRQDKSRSLKAVPERTGRSRSPAAERAYARRAQRTQNLRGAVPQRQPGTTPKAPFVVMVMVVLVAGIAAIMWLSTQAAADSYQLQDAHTQATNLSRQVEQLRQEVALAESPTELAKAAAKLGLVLAGDPAKLRQLPDGTVEVYGKPSAVEAPAPPPTASPPAGPPVQPPPADQQPPPADQQQQQPPADQQQQAVPGGQ